MSFPRLIKSFPQLNKSFPRDIMSFPRLNKSFPKDITSVPRLIESFPLLNKSFPQDIMSIPRLIKSFPQDIMSIPRLIKSFPRLISHSLKKICISLDRHNKLREKLKNKICMSLPGFRTIELRSRKQTFEIVESQSGKHNYEFSLCFT